MTMPKATSVHSIDLDNLEREMRRIAVSRRSVGRAKFPRIGCRPASVAPFHSSIRDNKDEPPAENGPASEVAIPQGLDSGSFGSILHTPSAAVPRPPSERRGTPTSRALALVVLCLLVTGGVGIAMMMRAGPMARSGTRTTAMGDQASSQQVARAAAQMPSPPDGLSTNPTQPLDVATSAKHEEAKLGHGVFHLHPRGVACICPSGEQITSSVAGAGSGGGEPELTSTRPSKISPMAARSVMTLHLSLST